MVVVEAVRVTMSRGPEELQIGQGSVLNVHTLLQSRSNTFSDALMASSAPMATSSVSPPVRILIITTPALLDSYQSDTGNADTELIRAFCEHIPGFADTDVDTKPIWHLITRVAGRACVIFDYGVSETDCKPPVAAFKAAFNGSALSINQFSHPGLEKEVNDTVKISRHQRAIYGARFPSRTDLRRHSDSRENAKAVKLVSKSSM